MNRRTALRAGFVGVGALAAGCNRRGAPTASPTVESQHDALAALEKQLPGRLGVCALDTGSPASLRYRADERFLMCSTAKTLSVAAVLQRSAREPGLLDRLIRYDQADVLEWAPVTSKHVDTGMTVEALCDAAITVSDNTAANLLVRLLGGPPAVTTFARSLGDNVTRVDRLEPDLNVTAPGDIRDTSTPGQMALNLRTLVLGDPLPPAPRTRFADLLKANTTGGKAIRAGLPRQWVVGDKTGSGAQGESNDLAIAWPPGRAPIVVAVYTAPDDPRVPADRARQIIARAATIAASALAPAGG
ncbi:class A beta-lactamase [Mycobacterium sp.]|uniref:class A beta-lactamase n=1 Tax=Mycobacterium sp. TaxID=1785 RepID=UPI0025EDCFD5|nr:class A beta-lactamase [Mycobacterium sp.]